MRKQSCIPLLAGGALLAMSMICSGQQSPRTLQAESPSLVTTRLKATTLQNALKEVSRLTGVRLSASSDTAELAVTILVKDLPLDVLRSRLAETLHLTWIRHEAQQEQPPSYLIYRSARNKEEELELSTRGERAFRKGIDEAIGVLSLTPEARAKLFVKRAALAETFAQSGGEAAVTLLAQISPELRASIMDGHKLEFPSSKPPPELASHFDGIMKQLKAATTDSIRAAMFDQEGKFSVTRTGEGAGSLIGIGFSVNNDTLSGSVGYSVKGVHAGEVYLGAYYPDHTGASYAETRRPVTIPTTLTAKSLDDLMEKVADTMHINIVGESYRQYVPANAKGEIIYPHSIEAGTTTIEQALDGIIWLDYWWKQGSVYLFQTPLWWIARRSQVTDVTLVALKEILQHRPLSFEGMAEIGKMLRAEQWGALTMVAKGNDTYLAETQTVMRFYGRLSAFRKADLFLQEGTDVSLLEDADRSRLYSWITEMGKERLQAIQNTPGKMRIMATRLPRAANQDPVQFRAEFQANDGATSLLREQIVMDGDPRFLLSAPK